MEMLSSLVQSPLLQPAAFTLMSIVLLAFFWWRAGSIRSVLDRLWHLMAGRSDVNDPILKELLINSRDLERFRFTYRLKVDSLAEVHKLHAWSAQHQIDLANLTALRDWVDPKHPRLIKAPPKSLFVIETLVVGVLAVSTFFFGALLLPSGALLQTKESGVYFRAQESSIEHPFRWWRYGADSCHSNLDSVMRETGFTRNEAELICAALKEGKLKSFIVDNQSTQRWLLALMAIVFVPWILSGVWKVTAAQAAFAMRSKTVEAVACSQRSHEESADMSGSGRQHEA